jgi:hypothetical protein
MKLIYLGVLLPVFFLISCNSPQPENEEVFPSDTILIDDQYPPIDPVALDIMDKFKICSLIDSTKGLPPCDAKYFRVFKYQPDKSYESGFIVEMVPGLFGSPVHQVIIIENVFGKFKIVNQYLGYLLEMRTTKKGYNDLIIAYDDPEIGVVAIRHEWNVDKYNLADVEEINDHYIKPEMKDSVNNMLLPAFSAGH